MMKIKENSTFNVLYTSDVNSTYDFYSKLGCEIREHTDEKVVLRFGGFDLHFILTSSEPFKDYEYIAEGQNTGQGVIFYAEVDDIQAMEVLVSQSGGKIISSTFKNHWDYREFLFEDPNGYKFAIYCK